VRPLPPLELIGVTLKIVGEAKPNTFEFETAALI
jgi:hypothetical protein